VDGNGTPSSINDPAATNVRTMANPRYRDHPLNFPIAQLTENKVTSTSISPLADLRLQAISISKARDTLAVQEILHCFEYLMIMILCVRYRTWERNDSLLSKDNYDTLYAE
jgi:hypothetical protein